MSNTYIDCIAYTKAPTGLVLTGFIGNIGRISACSVGATSLSLPTGQAINPALSQYDNLYIFDGPSSEIVQIGSGGASVGATTIPLQAGTQYAHVAGTPYCTDGSDGSLGEQIFTASKWIEDNICFQALWSTAYTNEILTLPTMRVAIDNKWNLHFRPRHFPVVTLTSISIQTSQTYINSIDPTQAIIDSDQQTVDIPNINFLSNSGPPPSQGSPYIWQQINRQSNAWITLAYTAGFAVGSLPKPIQRACTLLVSDCFIPLENPIGADAIQQNKRRVEFAIKGDTSGESLLYKKAVQLLQPYTTESF